MIVFGPSIGVGTRGHPNSSGYRETWDASSATGVRRQGGVERPSVVDPQTEAGIGRWMVYRFGQHRTRVELGRRRLLCYKDAAYSSVGCDPTIGNPSCPHRLVRPRTSALQAENGGSNPPGDTPPDRNPSPDLSVRHEFDSPRTGPRLPSLDASPGPMTARRACQEGSVSCGSNGCARRRSWPGIPERRRETERKEHLTVRWRKREHPL